MTEPARKKFTITKQAVEAVQAAPPRRFVASFDATHLDTSGVAAALRALADQVEAPAKLAARAEELRLRVAALDPDLATTTRITPKEHDGAYPIVANGQQVGSASFATLRALPGRQGSLFDLADEDEEQDEEPTDEEWAALDAEERDEPPTFSEDDDIEFYQHDTWKPGIVLDQASQFTYLIEDKHGRRWEVNVQCLRKPDEE